MRTNNFALRLPESLLTHLREAAAKDGGAMNQYVVAALTEKLASRKTALPFLAERSAGGNAGRAMEILERSGGDVDGGAGVAEILR